MILPADQWRLSPGDVIVTSPDVVRWSKKKINAGRVSTEAVKSVYTNRSVIDMIACDVMGYHCDYDMTMMGWNSTLGK